MEIKNVIFDFDGTIADTSKLFLNIAKTVTKEFGINVSDDNFDNFDKFKNMTIRQIKRKYNISFFMGPKLLKRGQEEYDKEVLKIKVFKEIKEVLYGLNSRGYKLGILSSNSVENINKVLGKENINIIRYVYSSKKLFGKSVVIKRILKEQRLNRKETIYIGDEIRDVEAAKKAKILSGAVTWGLNGKEILENANPDYIFEKPEDILNII